MYKDFDEVVHNSNLPDCLLEFDNLMKGKPNFDKKSKFIIKEVRSASRTGFIVINKNKNFQDGHTYLKNYKLCKLAIHYVEHDEVPINKNIYFLSSLIRLSTNNKYIQDLEQSIEMKKKDR